jgi:hypothetical protein
VNEWGEPIAEAPKKPTAKAKKQSKPTVNIPVKYLPFVDGSGDLGNVKNWKVQVQMGNSVGRGEPDVGGWGKVGYVFINPTTGEVVPVARSDEHRAGWDLMHELNGKKVVKNLKDFNNIYIHGTHVYTGEDYDAYRKMFQFWLDHGGEDIKVELYRSGRGGNETFLGTLSDFIAEKDFTPKKNVISKPGKELIAALESFAKMVTQALKNPRMEDQAVKLAQRVLDVLKRYRVIGVGGADEITAVEQAIASGDFQKIQDAVLGFNGLKNAMHQDLRKIVADERLLWSDEYWKFFGDVEAAKSAFDALGNI